MRKTLALATVSGLLMSATMAGAAIAAEAPAEDAANDVKVAGEALLERTNAMPVLVVFKGEEPYSIYFSAKNAVRYKKGALTTICRPPKGETIMCWTKASKTDPWVPNEQPAENFSRPLILDTLASQVQGFIQYGEGVKYDRTQKGANVRMRITGTFQSGTGAGQLEMRLSFAKKRATVNLFSNITGNKPYQSYKFSTVKPKKIKFPKM